MTFDEIDLFEKTQGQLESLHSELTSLTKKSSNDALNKFKLKFVNVTLIQANSLLNTKYKPFVDFDNFSEEELPTNSDVTMIVGQYLNCMEKLRSDNIKIHSGGWYWLADGKETAIKTAPPKKLFNK